MSAASTASSDEAVAARQRGSSIAMSGRTMTIIKLGELTLETFAATKCEYEDEGVVRTMECAKRPHRGDEDEDQCASKQSRIKISDASCRPSDDCEPIDRQSTSIEPMISSDVHIGKSLRVFAILVPILLLNAATTCLCSYRLINNAPPALSIPPADTLYRPSMRTVTTLEASSSLLQPARRPPTAPPHTRPQVAAVVRRPLPFTSSSTINHFNSNNDGHSSTSAEEFIYKQQPHVVAMVDSSNPLSQTSVHDQIVHQDQAGAADWAQRLQAQEVPLENGVGMIGGAQSGWPHSGQAVMAATRLNGGQNQTLLGSLINQALLRPPQNPLSRAIEATKMFVRQHQQSQQIMAAAAMTPASLVQNPSQQSSINSHLPSSVYAPSGAHQLDGPPQTSAASFPAPSTSIPATSHVTNKLYNFLAQPRGQRLTQSLAEVRRRQQQQQQQQRQHLKNATGDELNPITTSHGTSEPFQLASSEGNYQLLSSSGGNRGAVTLSAPYEQRPRANPMFALKRPTVATAAGLNDDQSMGAQTTIHQHRAHHTPELIGDSHSHQWQLTAANGTDLAGDVEQTLGAADEQQQQQQQLYEQVVDGQSGEPTLVASREHFQEISGQPHEEGGGHQWSVASQTNQDENADEQVGSAGQQVEDSNGPQQQQVQIMVEGGRDHIYERIEATDRNETQPMAESDQRNQPNTEGPQARNSTVAYVIQPSPAAAAAAGGGSESAGLVHAEEAEASVEPATGGASLQGDDNLLAIQLPSQYESVIRAPPEGHYDDYFKPLGGTITAASFNEHQQVTTGDNGEGDRGNSMNSTMMGHSTGSQSGEHFYAENQQKQPDYTYQYYLNQQQQQQPHDSSHAMDYNRNFVAREASPNGSYYQTVESASPAQNESTMARGQGIDSGEKYQIVIDQSEQVGARLVIPNRPAAAAAAALNPVGTNNSNHEDTIQLIVANSNDQIQDPNTNEKVITYTSEGNNLARLIGKPARHTFFNKDLNEIPLQPPPSALTSTTPRTPAAAAPTPRQQQGRLRSTRSPLVGTRIVNGTIAAPQPLSAETEAGANESGGNDRSGLEDGGGDGFSMELHDPVAMEEVDGQSGQFGRYATSDGHPTNGGARKAPNSSPNSGDPNRKQQGTQQQAVSEASNRKQSRPAQAERKHNGGGKQAQHSMQVQTIRRPQVTEARFQPKDLPMTVPTPMPTMGESTAKSISELPIKAKRLRDHQSDKNELMNELLTALDRVKAAIYKLQPLTAKMNAMYRKSVTSNTRDQILDNNKGTYAKRYPPGDYDDTYDRMHPSELIERQRVGQARRGRATTSTGAPRNISSNSNSSGSGSSSNKRRISKSAGRLEAQDSRANAVYLPAPRRMLEEMQQVKRNSTRQGGESLGGGADSMRAMHMRAGGNATANSSYTPVAGQIVYDDDGDDSLLQQFSRRQGDSSYRLIDDGSSLADNLTNWNVEGGEPDERGPLFGYRITIYQSPSGGGPPDQGDGSDPVALESSRERQIISYSLVDDGHDQPIEFSTVNSLEEGSSIQLSSAPRRQRDATTDQELALDLMTTSESSLVPMNERNDNDNEDDGDGVADEGGGNSQLDNAESAPISEGSSGRDDDDDDAADNDSHDGNLMMSPSGKAHEFSDKKKKGHKKSNEEEKAAKKKRAKKKGSKEGEKRYKHQAEKKKGQEEHKKKKEFKKIKHHKGVMSKESHKLHRDKHIKAHDRGAAKEKALKERTQIEFFEREQIVDDEFEKGKKSTMKAGWASGHDSKKTSTEMGKPEHDSMSMGGSQRVGHLLEPAESNMAASTTSTTTASTLDSTLQPAASASSLAPMMMDSAASEHHGHQHHHHGKGKGHSTETSSGKQTNKYEKKQMEAKGKKFKGWREKGYKIITETEFIDRGSLHDSAYKKRDKGAAHHQKFKKHEAKSEGHQGSMHEHHKKSHKKEEKKSKSEEKKKEMMGKEEGKEAKKGHKKKKSGAEEESEHKKGAKKHFHDHEHSESAPVRLETLQVAPGGSAIRDGNHSKSAAASHNRGSTNNQLGERQRRHRELRAAAAASTSRPSVIPAPTARTAAEARLDRTPVAGVTAQPTNATKSVADATVQQQQQQQQPPTKTVLPKITNTTISLVGSSSLARHGNSSDQTNLAQKILKPEATKRPAVGAAAKSYQRPWPNLKLPAVDSMSNATLLDIIDRLNISRSESNRRDESRNTLTSAIVGHNLSDRRAEQSALSPLLRLVDSLTRINQTSGGGRFQSRNQRRNTTPNEESISRPAEQPATKPQTLPMNRVQFDDQLPVRATVAPPRKPLAPPMNGFNALAESQREQQTAFNDNHLPAEVIEQNRFIRPMQFESQFGLTDRSIGNQAIAYPSPSSQQPPEFRDLDFLQQLAVGQQQQQQIGDQYFGASNHVDQQQVGKPPEHQQNLLLPNPNFNFLDPSIADYDALPSFGAPVSMPLFPGAPMAQSQQMQQFNFLTD